MLYCHWKQTDKTTEKVEFLLKLRSEGRDPETNEGVPFAKTFLLRREGDGDIVTSKDKNVQRTNPCMAKQPAKVAWAEN